MSTRGPTGASDVAHDAAAEHREALALFTTGVTIVTTLDRHGRAHGLTVSAFLSLSLEPALVAIAIDRRAGCLSLIRDSGIFAVNVLRSGQEGVAQRFAARGRDRFATIAWRPECTGAPVMHDLIVSAVDCEVASQHAGGDHVIIVGAVRRTWAYPDRVPLVHQARRFLTLC